MVKMLIETDSCNLKKNDKPERIYLYLHKLIPVSKTQKEWKKKR